jgi:hypothetical protein
MTERFELPRRRYPPVTHSSLCVLVIGAARGGSVPSGALLATHPIDAASDDTPVLLRELALGWPATAKRRS